METILIATDFSKAGKNATRYGFALSKAIKAKVILLNVYQLPSVLPESSIYLPPTDLEKVAYQQLADQAETFDPHATVALETQCRQGPVGDAVLSVAGKNNVSFIVIGMKRSGRELRKYFGSTVTLLSKESPIPLIVVPEEAAFVIPKTIVLASDTSDANMHILEPLKQVGTTFNSTISVVRVIRKSEDGPAERGTKSAKLDWFLNCLDHSFEYVNDENVAKGLNNYVKKNEVDMVAVIPHKHTFMERLVTRSVTKDLIFHTRVPLLILPGGDEETQIVSDEVYSGADYNCAY